MGRVETIGNATLYLGDCRDILPTLGKVDAVVTDPPYGTTQNNWDTVPDLQAMWAQFLAVCKDDAAFVFTAAEPFMSDLIQSKRAFFKYDMVWIKTQAVGHLNARIMPMRNHENIAVFGKGRITFNPQLRNKPKENIRPVGRRAPSENYGSFGEFAERSIPMDKRYPLSAEIYENVNVGEAEGHPTQKPVKMFSDFVSTYSNANEIILDPFMGSGTTGVAAVQMGRKFIGIEREPKYFDIACRRIEDAQRQGDMFLEAVA